MKKIIQLKRVVPLIWIALLGFSYHATAQIADVTSQLNTWQTFDFVEGVQTGEFTFEFDMTAEKVNIDAVTGLTNVAAVSTYSDMSVIVRFNSSGMIDAYDGSGYASENDLTYSAGTTYAVRVEVDASTMSYDVYVTPDGGSEITIADGYTFRNKVINLTGMAVVNGDFNVADPGNHDTENIVLTHISENTDPVFVQLDEQNVNEGSDLEVTVEAVDPLDAAITLTQSGLPGFGTFMDNGDNTATISVSPEVGDLGQYTITVTATSTTGTNTQDVVINVNEYSEIFTIESEPEDIDLYYHVDTRNPAVLNWGGTEMLVGGGVNWQDAADEYDMAAVMPFQIPEIPQGSNSFKSATFSANVNYVVTWAYVDYDLYGLDYRDEPTVLGTDYYQGVYDGDENATAIQQKWAATSGPTSQTVEPGVVATTIEGGESLTDYLNAQLQAGAEPGDYVFLRVNVNVANATTYARIDIDSHESDNPPVLDVTFYQPLILDPIGDHVVTRDEETTIDLNATFAEADPMVFSVEGEPAFVALTDNNDGTAVLTLTPVVDDLGNHRDIVVTVTAGEYTYEETITLTVTEAPNAIYVDAADSYTVFGEAYDPAEAFVWSGAPEILTGGSYVDADAVDHAAVMPFEIPAIPDGMVIATATLELTTNQVPAWMPHSNDLTALPYRDAATVLGTDHYSGPYGGDPSAYPIQEDFITPTTAVGLTNTSEKGNEAIVQYLNEQLAAGAEAGDFVFFRLNADQETKLTDWARVDINSHESSSNTGGAYLTVTLMPNNAPVIDAIVDQTMLERRSLEVDVTGSDADGDPLLFNLAAGTPSFIAITDNGDGTAKVTISPTVDDTGEITVEVEATDGLEKSTQSFTLTVNASNLPVLAAIADQSVREGLSETVALSATDADVDDVLTLTLSGAPDFVVLTDNGDGTGSLAIDPMVGDEGTYADISVSVSDGFDDVEQLFTLTVSANAAPVLAGIGNQTMTSERTHSIAISATDADSDDLAFSIASEHAFVTLVDNGDGTGSIEVDGADVSPDDYENIVVSVTDSNESVSETIKITMVQNSLPSLTAIGDQTAVIDETTEVALAASDDDASDQLVFSISDNAPSFVKLTDNGDGTGKLTMTPAAADLGEHKDIVVKVSDGLGQAIETIMVTVEEATVTSVSHLQNEMAVFPNPTVNGIVNVQIPAELNGGKLSLFGITGKLMQQVQLSDTASKQPYQLTINRSVPKGQYVMILSNASLTVTKRLVIQ